jgi:hypothetical protein
MSRNGLKGYGLRLIAWNQYMFVFENLLNVKCSSCRVARADIRRSQDIRRRSQNQVMYQIQIQSQSQSHSQIQFLHRRHLHQTSLTLLIMMKETGGHLWPGRLLKR